MANSKDSDIRSTVHELLAEKLGLGVDEIADGKSIVADLEADSLDVIEIIIAIEERYEIEIPDSEAETLDTPGRIIEYLSKKIE